MPIGSPLLEISGQRQEVLEPEPAGCRVSALPETASAHGSLIKYSFHKILEAFITLVAAPGAG